MSVKNVRTGSDFSRTFRLWRGGLLLIVLAPTSLLMWAQQSTGSPVAPAMTPTMTDPTAAPVQKPRSPAEQPITTKEAGTKGSQAAPTNFPAVVPQGRLIVGLALEGGGALGLAHIGVLQWLDEHHVPIDRIAGTSMGCLIGALQASGRTSAEMTGIASGSDFQDVFALQAPYDELSFRRKEDRTEMPQAITLGLKHGAGFRNALLTDEGLNDFLLERFSSYAARDLTFDALPTPLRCVATDLNTLKPVIFRDGSLPEAVRASISIPGVFAPFSYKGHFLVDGAIVDNLPSDVVRNQLKADVVIAVHLEGTAFEASDVGSILSVFSRAYAAGTAQTEQSGIIAADQVIRIATSTFSTSDYSKSKDLIAAGYQAAEANRSVLQPYALDDAAWAAFQGSRAKRGRPAPGLLQALTVEGGSPGAQAAVRHDLEPLHNQPISAAMLIERLQRVQSDGTNSAAFETFDPVQSTSSQSHSDTGVRVLLRNDPKGPPYLLLGPSIAAMTGNITETTFDVRVVDQNLGGYGSELRSDVRLGYLTQLSTQYHRLLMANGLFMQPQLDLIRRPVYVWSHQQRIAEYFEQRAGGGLSVGRTFTPRLQMAAEWHADALRWEVRTGQGDSANISGTTQTGLLHLTYDGSESGTVSPRGLRVEASTGALFHSPGSPLAPILHLQVMRTNVWREKNIFGLGLSADTYFRRNVTDPLRVTLGGPFRLSASSIDEYRGTDDYLVRAGYLRRILALPSGIGQGIYASLAYEAGEIWSPDRAAMLRQDVVGGVIAVTPLGGITFGGSLGDAGRRKIFVSVGRMF